MKEQEEDIELYKNLSNDKKVVANEKRNKESLRKRAAAKAQETKKKYSKKETITSSEKNDKETELVKEESIVIPFSVNESVVNESSEVLDISSVTIVCQEEEVAEEKKCEKFDQEEKTEVLVKVETAKNEEVNASPKTPKYSMRQMLGYDWFGLVYDDGIC